MTHTVKWLFALLAISLTGCTSLPFHLDRHLTFTLADAGLAVKNVTLVTTDGERIAAWFLPAVEPSPGDPDPPARGRTLLFSTATLATSRTGWNHWLCFTGKGFRS